MLFEVLSLWLSYSLSSLSYLVWWSFIGFQSRKETNIIMCVLMVLWFVFWKATFISLVVSFSHWLYSLLKHFFSSVPWLILLWEKVLMNVAMPLGCSQRWQSVRNGEIQNAEVLIGERWVDLEIWEKTIWLLACPFISMLMKYQQPVCFLLQTLSPWHHCLCRKKQGLLLCM